ncbi:hypothetical protein ASC95_11065 [Pelomonas sp. Root1217]|uniref:diguanylate cyclase domain-containing protein n=1 Tax=Pelomonas sp. Root1217 TaxID=1736430 RepID=UPI0007095FFA|nr:diguanylate cyclase [Pelomonas sp. Root1217]KQV53285.1 hypothetical protein ASC95_11065 [Pelomonas sp. Root1217]
MKIRSLFIAAGAVAALVGTSAIVAMWTATRLEGRAEAQQQRAQQVARDVAGLVGVTHVFQRERDELSVSEWKSWHANIVRDLADADLQGSARAEVELLKDAAGRLPTLFERALKTAAAPASDFQRRRHDQAFELLLGDTQAMADAAFRWSRNAGDARRLAEDVHEQVTMAAVVAFSVLLVVLASVGVRRVLRPLAMLTQATEALERGEQVPLFGSTAQDELGTLKRRFDAMTIALQRRTGELREAEQRMRALADNVPVLITEFDADARIVFANATAGRVYGVPAEALLGKHVSDVRGEDGERQVRPFIDAVLRGQSVEFDSTQSLHGAQRHFHQRYVPRRDALYTVVGFYSVSMDITERKAAELAVQASELRLKAITDNIPVVVSHFDQDLRADFGNLAAERVLRRPISELLGQTFREIRGDAVWEIAKPHIDAVMQGQARQFESFVTHGDGTLYFAQRYVPDIDAAGQVQGFYSVSFDITERRQAEAKLAESEKRLRDIADNLPVMISYIDKDQRLLFLNETFSKWTGLDHRTTVGKTVAEAVPAALYEQRREHLARALGGERVEFHVESVAAGAARSLHNLYLPDVAEDGSIRGLYALSTDVTERRQLERQLAELARTDALTGLPNRYSFNEQLAAVIKRAHRAQSLSALLFLDIDRFKLINDSYGHGVGDEVLCEFARRLQQLVRGTDFVGRLAGDEFIVVLEGLHAASEAEIVAGKIITAINRPFATSVGELSIATSIGIAVHPRDELGGEELLGRADQALYLAKGAGRNQYRLHAS